MKLVKGHGTQNDFLLLPDLDGTVELSAAAVRALCRRHAGIGADGVLRVVRSANDPAAHAFAAEAEFFMDYRNADGSLAEMCGNGARVFFAYLRAEGLVDGSAAVATRGGVRQLTADADGTVTVDMGTARLLADRPTVTVTGGPPRQSSALELPNPHVVVRLDSCEELAALDLRVAPHVTPALPSGQNVEFVTRTGPRALQMRVHERGVGETRSCGTGICAAVVAVAVADGAGPDGDAWQVVVPGGACTVRWLPDGQVLLNGPAMLVGEVDVDDAWLAAVGPETVGQI